MTPETRDAIEGLEYAVAAAEESELGYVTVDTAQLRALLAAADANEPAYVPSDCPHCPDGHRDPTTRPWTASMSVYRDRDRQPTHLIVAPSSGGHVAESDAEWLRQVIRDARARHRPLTDESCGVIPTKAGRRLVDDYRAHRTQQHPKAEH